MMSTLLRSALPERLPSVITATTIIGDRGTRSFKQLTELFAGNGMIGYVAKERVDGKLILPEAVQILTITGSAKAAKA